MAGLPVWFFLVSAGLWCSVGASASAMGFGYVHLCVLMFSQNPIGGVVGGRRRISELCVGLHVVESVGFYCRRFVLKQFPGYFMRFYQYLATRPVPSGWLPT